jgi:hypothetical protein
MTIFLVWLTFPVSDLISWDVVFDKYFLLLRLLHVSEFERNTGPKWEFWWVIDCSSCCGHKVWNSLIFHCFRESSWEGKWHMRWDKTNLQKKTGHFKSTIRHCFKENSGESGTWYETNQIFKKKQGISNQPYVIALRKTQGKVAHEMRQIKSSNKTGHFKQTTPTILGNFFGLHLA